MGVCVYSMVPLLFDDSKSWTLLLLWLVYEWQHLKGDSYKLFTWYWYILFGLIPGYRVVPCRVVAHKRAIPKGTTTHTNLMLVRSVLHICPLCLHVVSHLPVIDIKKVNTPTHSSSFILISIFSFYIYFVNSSTIV